MKVAISGDAQRTRDQYQAFLDGKQVPPKINVPSLPPTQERHTGHAVSRWDFWKRKSKKGPGRRLLEQIGAIGKTWLPRKKKHIHLGEDSICDLLTKILLVLFAAFLLTKAFLGPLWRAELESNEFPIVSLQYRGSIFQHESDLEHIKQDLPNLYNAAKWLGDDYFCRLMQVSETEWYVFYFPIYPMLCLPVKLFFQLLHVDQERCFIVTNALLVLFSLWFVYRRLNVTAKQKLAAVALLMASPVIYNVNYIYYMAFMSAFVTMSLVQYHNKCYKSSALLLSIAGMSNSTIMFVGIVMIAEYLTHTAIAFFRGPKDRKSFGRCFVKTACYGACYLPCLAQFVICRIVNVPTFGIGNGIDHYFYARFLMYLFDPALGFGTFAPFTLAVFLIIVLLGLFRKRPQALLWGAMLCGTVAAFSIMSHINCGMQYCARYLIFCYPIIPIFLATEGYEIIKSTRVKRIMYPVLFTMSVLLLYVNAPVLSMVSYSFNPMTQWILNYAPQIYNPYSATFYCRTLHVDGAYGITDPAYYCDPQTEEIRKLIFKADGGQAEKVLYELTGDEASVEYLQEQLYRYGTDGNFHYVNFPASGEYQVREKTIEEKGEVVERITLVNESDVSLADMGGYQLAGFPLTIREDTIYKVELTLADDVDFGTASGLIVDFYAGPAYDRAEQESSGFVKEDRYQYTFYFDSGEFDGDVLDCSARVFVGNLDTVIQVESFSVTEMENLLTNSPFYRTDPFCDEIREIHYIAAPETVSTILDDLGGDAASIAYLRNILQSNDTDGMSYTIEFPSGGMYQVHYKTPEEKGEMRSIEVLVKESGFSLADMGEYQLAAFPLTIEEDTIYKVELTLADGVNFDTASGLVVDFYAGPAYDRAEQESSGFVKEGRYQYTFYFDSGEFDGDVLDCSARVFVWNLDTVMQVESFSVTEMESLLIED